MNSLRKKLNSFKKGVLLCLALAIVIVLAGGVKVAWALWLEPPTAPPGKNISAPLSVGQETQVKQGNLRLDPNYDPASPPTTVTHPLEVSGTGELTSAAATSLQAAAMLYVDAATHRVGIGTNAPSVRLSVLGGSATVGAAASPLIGQAVSAENTNSSGGHGVLGTASASGMAGVYGVSANAGGLGVWGLSDTSGVNARSGVSGRSTGGYGVSGRTYSTSQPAISGSNTSATSVGWAGYFAGRLGAGSDMIANRFLPTDLRRSLLPFTSGQEIMTTQPSEGGNSGTIRSAFDGSNLWVVTQGPSSVNGYDIFKYRASDGKQLLAVPTTPPGDLGAVAAIVFDGTDLWVGDYAGQVTRRSVATGAIIDSLINLNLDSFDQLNDMAVSVENGQKYIWVALSNNNNGNDRLVKISATPPYTSLNVPQAPWQYITSITFDGQYIWAQSHGQHLKKILASSPDAGTDYGAYVTGYLHWPGSMVFDGEYIWSVSYTSAPGFSTQILDRVWAANPADPQYPPLHIDLVALTGDVNPHAKGLTFDGTYIWVGLAEGFSGKLLRIPANTNTDVTASITYKLFPTTFRDPSLLTFDGTYLWVTAYDDSSTRAVKIYSGTGMGHTDLNTVVNLDPGSAPAAQTGNFNISGSAQIGDAAVDALTVGGDAVVAECPDGGNCWGGSDQTIPVSGGTADCPAGTFIKGITIDSNSKLENGAIVCRQL